jgi:hypothetical protein
MTPTSIELRRRIPTLRRENFRFISDFGFRASNLNTI